jgi:hypothetical protein
MKTEVKTKTRATYTFTLEEVLKALGLDYVRSNEHCISIGMDNQTPTVEIIIESCKHVTLPSKA